MGRPEEPVMGASWNVMSFSRIFKRRQIHQAIFISVISKEGNKRLVLRQPSSCMLAASRPAPGLIGRSHLDPACRHLLQLVRDAFFSPKSVASAVGCIQLGTND